MSGGHSVAGLWDIKIQMRLLVDTINLTQFCFKLNNFLCWKFETLFNLRAINVAINPFYWTTVTVIITVTVTVRGIF